jgi:integrase
VSEYLTKRNGVWHYQRRVPEEFAAFDKRVPVRLTTGIKVVDDKRGRKAIEIAERLNLDTEAYWRMCAGGNAAQAKLVYDAAVKRSLILDLPYLPAAAIAKEAPADLIRRIDALGTGDRVHDPETRAAVLGAVAAPTIKLSGLYAEFDLATATERLGYSPRQLKKFKAAKERAIEILIEVVGDGTVNDLTREKMLKLRDHWSKRVKDEGIQVRTANKNISHITRMVREVSMRHNLDKETIVAGLRLRGGKDGSRSPYPIPFITGVILRPGALDDLNDQARAVVRIMVNTGLRPVEIINLTPGFILLDAEIPHVRVKPFGRVLKSQASERDVPLVGISLDAMREFPIGFAQYADNGDTLSATVNKYFEENGIWLSKMHTLYSLRHSLKDRLRSVECPDELTDELMGHASGKPKYGDGHGLKLKLKYLQMIALAPAELSAAVCRHVA